MSEGFNQTCILPKKYHFTSSIKRRRFVSLRCTGPVKNMQKITGGEETASPEQCWRVRKGADYASHWFLRCVASTEPGWRAQMGKVRGLQKGEWSWRYRRERKLQRVKVKRAEMNFWRSKEAGLIYFLVVTILTKDISLSALEFTALSVTCVQKVLKKGSSWPIFLSIWFQW